MARSRNNFSKKLLFLIFFLSVSTTFFFLLTNLIFSFLFFFFFYFVNTYDGACSRIFLRSHCSQTHLYVYQWYKIFKNSNAIFSENRIVVEIFRLLSNFSISVRRLQGLRHVLHEFSSHLLITLTNSPLVPHQIQFNFDLVRGAEKKQTQKMYNLIFVIRQDCL